MQIQIKATPQLDTFIRNIERLSENLTDGFDWESLAPIVAEAAEGIFASQGRGGWAQLSPAYARWKERNFPGKGILELTGAYLQCRDTDWCAAQLSGGGPRSSNLWC